MAGGDQINMINFNSYIKKEHTMHGCVRNKEEICRKAGREFSL